MNQTIHHILQELETDLISATAPESVIIAGRSAEELQGYMRLYKFRNTVEEILYFKVFKPRFLAHLICAQSASKQATLYPWIEHMLEQQEFYEYYTAGLSHRDGFYFSERRCNKLDFDLKEPAEVCGQGYDHWVARILAEEWVKRKCGEKWFK